MLVQVLPALPPGGSAVALVPAAWLAYRVPRARVLLVLLLGVAWASLRAGALLADRLAPSLEEEALTVQGMIASLPQATRRGYRFVFDVERAWRDDSSVVAAPGRILLSLYQPLLVPRAGDRWRLTVRLKRPHGFQNPGGFDYEAYLFTQGIGARGYVRAAPAPQSLPAAGWRGVIPRWRQAVGQRLRALAGERPAAAIVLAVAIGDRQGLSPDQWRTLRATGTNHLMAISGLHIGLVAGLVFALVRRLWARLGTPVLWWPAPKAAAAAGFAVACLYAALAGFSIPTQRALIMVGVVFGGVLLQRRWPPSTVLAVALLGVLIHDPLAVLAIGFWLSFAAVTVLVYALADHRGLWPRYIRPQLLISVGLLPWLLAFFQYVSLTAPLANVVAIPVFAVAVVPLVLLSAALSAFAGPAGLLLGAASWLIERLWTLLALLAALPYSSLSAPAPGPWAMLCGVIGTALLLAPRGWPGRWVGAVWLLPLLWPRLPAPAPGELWFTLLDVGQGLAAVVRTAGHTLVFDTGPRFSPDFDTGQAVVLPYLRSVGVGRIDTLIVSHGDNDHLGGAGSVLEGMGVGTILTSVPARLPGATACRTGQTWTWDGVRFDMLSPPNGHIGSGNNASCVLRVRTANGAVLLPADIESATETELVERFGPALRATVLVAPHHGSKTSSSEDFVAAVDPRMVLYPIGYRNRYHHPHPDVRARYARRHVAALDSARSGAVELRLGPGGLATHVYRDEHRRYWYAD